MTIDNKIGFQTLSGIANSHPLIKTAFKYWWLALPAGWAFYSMIKERPKVTVGGSIADFAITFGPVISLIMLAEMMERNQKLDAAAAANPPALPISGEIREAQFNITAGRTVPGPQYPGTTPNFNVPKPFPSR